MCDGKGQTKGQGDPVAMEIAFGGTLKNKYKKSRKERGSKKGIFTDDRTHIFIFWKEGGKERRDRKRGPRGRRYPVARLRRRGDGLG